LPEGTTFRSRTEDSLRPFKRRGPSFPRELLRRLTNEDLSNEAFPFMQSRRIPSPAFDVLALRVSFTVTWWTLQLQGRRPGRSFTTRLPPRRNEGGRRTGWIARADVAASEKGYGQLEPRMLFYSPEYWQQEVKFDRLVKLTRAR